MDIIKHYRGYENLDLNEEPKKLKTENVNDLEFFHELHMETFLFGRAGVLGRATITLDAQNPEGRKYLGRVYYPTGAFTQCAWDTREEALCMICHELETRHPELLEKAKEHAAIYRREIKDHRDFVEKHLFEATGRNVHVSMPDN